MLLQAAAAIRGASYLVFPVMPRSVERIWGFLNEAEEARGGPLRGARLRWLRPRPQGRDAAGSLPAGRPEGFPGRGARRRPAASASPATPGGQAGSDEGGSHERWTSSRYEEFKKMDLRVAQILEAERVPGATKILKLKIDIGTEQRQMVAGIAETYAPEDLVGKKLIVIVNLKPAVIRGIESQAMLLAAITADNKALVPFFDRDIPAGAVVK
ncbi:MAG: methionine--tRNA ligase subunit beta [Ignavibacteriales bacterium]|nr:methionine--tRNA ligase subunit beta [Ignavibacteriales bacterium]